MTLAHSFSHMPLGDREKHKHFDATNDPARREHFNQRRHDIEHGASGGAWFHFHSKRQAWLKTISSFERARHLPPVTSRVVVGFLGRLAESFFPLSRFTSSSRAPGRAKVRPLSFNEGQTSMTLYWHETGPLVKYRQGVLLISDLNPQISTEWRMSRFEMFKLGLQSIRAAITGGR